MICQSAVLCSLLDTVCSLSNDSVFGSAGFASAGLCTASGLTSCRLSVFEGDWASNNRREGSNRCLRGVPQCKGRAGHILDSLHGVFWSSSFHAWRRLARDKTLAWNIAPRFRRDSRELPCRRILGGLDERSRKRSEQRSRL